jgi:hypothetical protein
MQGSYNRFVRVLDAWFSFLFAAALFVSLNPFRNKHLLALYSPSLRGSGCYLFGLKARLGLKILTLFWLCVLHTNYCGQPMVMKRCVYGFYGPSVSGAGEGTEVAI